MNRTLRTAVTAGLALAAVLAFLSCLGEAEEPQRKIAVPYISIQPQSASYFTGAYTATPLSIEVWDWKGSDGRLSYQWFAFEDIEEYCKNRGGEAIPGETGMSYTPALTPAPDKQFYYYVVVTNTNNDALGVKNAAVQSEVAVISFSAPGDPLYPVIRRHPASANYGWGALLNALKVEASLPPAVPGILSYQWYSNEEFSIEDGTLVALADQNSFIPDYSELALGPNYSFVKVTNTVGSGDSAKKAISVSVPAIITLEPGKNAAAPRIDTQPRSHLYFIEELTPKPVQALEVEAASPDQGNLSYQWYSSTTDRNTGGTLITANGTGASYLPPVTAAGNYFYYVVVTNTNQNVTQTKTATVSSRPAKVTLASSAAGENANLYVSIPDPSVPANRYQYIRGYGGMDVAWGNFPRTRPSDTELMYDPNRMGYNILRIMIKPNYIDIEKTMQELLAGDRPDYYENVKIVNKYGGYVLASPWTPPKEWKSNNSVNGGGILIPSYYKLFATYLRNFAQHMYNNGAPIYAISISNEPNYVAGYDGCEWDDMQPGGVPHMRNFFLEVGHFTDGIRGYGGGKDTPYVLTMNGESANTPTINLPALRDPQSKASIDLLARHVYGERTVSLWNGKDAAGNKFIDLIRRPDGTMMEVWMTEHNINSANATGYYNDSTWNYVWRYMNDVDLVIRMNNENAFVWWASKRFYSMIGDGQFGTIGAAEKDEPPTPYPRGWGLSHYAKYSIDTTRINIAVDTAKSKIFAQSGGEVAVPHIEWANSVINNTTDNMDNISARITAFVSADGSEISMVLWTPTKTTGNDGYSMGTVEIKLPPGFTAQSATATRSWGQLGTEMFQQDVDGSKGAVSWKAVRLNADRDTAYVDVPRGQILSVKFTK
jgi:O-glycosyl hydrolase